MFVAARAVLLPGAGSQEPPAQGRNNLTHQAQSCTRGSRVAMEMGPTDTSAPKPTKESQEPAQEHIWGRLTSKTEEPQVKWTVWWGSQVRLIRVIKGK